MQIINIDAFKCFILGTSAADKMLTQAIYFFNVEFSIYNIMYTIL